VIPSMIRNITGGMAKNQHFNFEFRTGISVGSILHLTQTDDPSLVTALGNLQLWLLWL